MQYATNSLSANKHVGIPTELSAMNERLSLALESARQVAFDWHIPSDRLYFSGELINGLKTVSLDTAATWNSRALTPLIHAEDHERFRKHLHDALKGTGIHHDGFHRVELRLKDVVRGWLWVDISGKIVERSSDGRAIRMVGTFCDIDERKRAETKVLRMRDLYAALNRILLRKNAMRYRQLIKSSPEAIFVYRGTELTLVNQAAIRLLGGGHAHDLLGRNVLDFVHSNYHAPLIKCALTLQEETSCASFMEQVWLRLDGTPFHAEIATSSLIYDGASVVQAVVRDISERKRAEAIQLGQNRVLNMVATGAALADILREIAQFAESQSPGALCAIQQLDTDGQTFNERVAPTLPKVYLAQIATLKIGTENGSCGMAACRLKPVVVTDIATDPRWSNLRDSALSHGLKACSSWPLLNKTGQILGTFAFYFRESIAPSRRDLQIADVCVNLASIAIESRMSEEKIRYLAHYDGLTSLPNRFLFNEYLDLALRNAQRHTSKFAVLFVDLDKFKEINDTLGHAAGDQVLRDIASRLRKCLRHTDKIARMGGDEFYVLIEELSDGRYAADVAQKLLAAASGPISVDGANCRLSASIGIAIYPDNGSDSETLLKNADDAMYQAKEAGKNNYRFFVTAATRDPENPPQGKLPPHSRRQEDELTQPG